MRHVVQLGSNALETSHKWLSARGGAKKNRITSPRAAARKQHTGAQKRAKPRGKATHREQRAQPSEGPYTR